MHAIASTLDQRSTSSARQSGRAGRPPTVESIERACRGAVPTVPNAEFSAITEALEPRTHLTATFNAFVSGVQTASHTQAYMINLWTTGGEASQWVINWGDNSPNTTIYATSYIGNKFPVPVQVSHNYAAQTWTITATATPAAGGSPVTATNALTSTFGNVSNRGAPQPGSTLHI